MLSFSQVSKRYPRQTKWAVNKVSFSIEPATISALLGPNGAGKTTCMKMAAGLLYPDSGQIEIGGINPVKNIKSYRRLVGLHLGGDFGFYNRSGVLENLEFFASLSGVPRKTRQARCREVLEQVGLLEKSKSRVEELSHGMKQRLHLARAIVAKPPVILLDEPTSGLDPVQSTLIRKLISDLREDGSSILLSTHRMNEAYELADTIHIIKQGSLLFSGTSEQILAISQKPDLETAYLWIMNQYPELLKK